MLLIELLMKEITKEEYIKYKKQLNTAMQIPLEELFCILDNKIANYNMVVVENRNITMIALPTSGCPHRIHCDGFYGCSMCNYNASTILELANMEALKKRSPEFYGMLIEKYLLKARSSLKKLSAVELITGYDCLNSEEIPDQVFHNYIESKEVLRRKVRPIVSIFETRVTSVNEDKILGWKKNLGKKVVVEFGVEVSHDWIRNHWINKSAGRQAVIKAIEIIHETGCEASGNILIGIPGCTEEQSIQLFIKSEEWLYEIGCDHILCSALCRKDFTMQYFLYETGEKNEFLRKSGLYNGEHTCIPYIFTTMEAICQLIEQHEEMKDRLALSPANFSIYYSQLKMIRFLDKDKIIIQRGIEALKCFSESLDVKELRVCLEEMKDSNLYKEYADLLNRQRMAGDIKETLYHVAKACIEECYPATVAGKIKLLDNEMSLFEQVI